MFPGLAALAIRQALDATGGDIEQAADLLLAQGSAAAASPTPTSELDELLARLTRDQAASAAAGTQVDDKSVALAWLVQHMGPKDRAGLSTGYVLEHIYYAFIAAEKAAEHWGPSAGTDTASELFLNFVLPYSCINERRDPWREDFHSRFWPIAAVAPTTAQAVIALNRAVFSTEPPGTGVKYSTERPKADQSPYESEACGLASCTGLAVLLVDACRAVGIPARFVGTPRWTDNSGNHSWVEVFVDGDWHFTGASEPAALDTTWFNAKAALNATAAVGGSPANGIYATSFAATLRPFPLVWDQGADTVWGIDVSARYLRVRVHGVQGVTATSSTEPSVARVGLKAEAVRSRQRRPVWVALITGVVERNGQFEWDGDGSSGVQIVFQGLTNDESADANDHLTATLERNTNYLGVAFISGHSAGKPVSDAEVMIKLGFPGKDVDPREQSSPQVCTFDVAVTGEAEQLVVFSVPAEHTPLPTTMSFTQLEQDRLAQAIGLQLEYDAVGAARGMLSDEEFLQQMLGAIEGVDVDAAVPRIRAADE
jgi:hypothetical protein